MIWFSAIKLAINAGTHIYKKKQETKMLMADGAARHAHQTAGWSTTAPPGTAAGTGRKRNCDATEANMRTLHRLVQLRR